MLICRYTDPPLTDEEKQKQEQAKKNGEATAEAKNDYDITDYILKYEWSGDVSQAARKLEFSTAHNTPDKDSSFTALDLKLGGFITLTEKTEESQEETEFFTGRIFFRKRSTDGYTFEYTAYDDMIYLAKSHISMLFECSVSDGIKQICSHMGIEVAEDFPSIPTKVSFFADDKSCTEAIRMLLDKAKADSAVNKDYNALCINGAVTCVPKGEMIEDYVATDKTNVISSEHSESVEDMVNRVIMVDEKGSVCQTFTNTDDQTHFGTLEKVYKAQPPKKDESVDNVAGAKALLSRTKEESSLNGLGYIQCIAGYTIKAQEENLKGNFFIKTDSHSFENNVHTMQLTLEYMPDKQEEPKIEQRNYREPEFKAAKKKKRKKKSTKTTT